MIHVQEDLSHQRQRNYEGNSVQLRKQELPRNLFNRFYMKKLFKQKEL